MSIKRSLFLPALLAFVALLFPLASVSAHVLAVDGTMGAVMHIDPNDDPIANSPAQLFFQFKNTTGPFSVADCKCQVSITELNSSRPVSVITSAEARSSAQVALPAQGSAAAATTTLASIGPVYTGDTLSFPYTFPEEAVYAIAVDGTSTNASFPAFHLNYDVRVDEEAVGQAKPSELQGLLAEHLVHLIIVIVGIIIGIIITIVDRKKRKL